MPELPEVETLARDLHRAGLVGRTFTDAALLWERTLDRPSLTELRARLPGQRVEGIRRRGKYLILDLSDGDTLIIHLRMTGRLDIVPATDAVDPHTRAILALDDGSHLRFRDQRKFGRLYLVADAAEITEKLGPEPIDSDFTAADLRARLAGRSRQLKPLLLDQSFLAGLGNIYVDEALWHANLHPLRTADSLADAEIEALWEAARLVLWRGIGNEGTSFSTYFSVGGKKGSNQEALAVFRRTGEPCPRCGTPVQRLVIAQRSSHLCPTCQPLPPPSDIP